MTAGRPAEAREVAGLVAELRRLGVCWKRIERLLGWRLSPATLKRMVREFRRAEAVAGAGILTPRGALAAGGEVLACAEPAGAASPDVAASRAYSAASAGPGDRS